MKKRVSFYIICTLSFVLSACNYLDIVPDNIPTMDMVFTTRSNAEKMLLTCYAYMPEHGNVLQNPGLGASDEVWNCSEKTFYYTNLTSFNIAKGNQNVSDPYLNYWSGGQDGRNMFVAIRDCNIFIENVDKVPDMTSSEKKRWKSEVKVLKAFYHYWLMQLYGPIPFVDENIDVSADPSTVKVEREPVDVVVDKIVTLLDEVLEDDGLPLFIRAEQTEMGRLTRPAALAIKAKVLTLAASPLFNGNPDFKDYKNDAGTELINSVEDQHKWELARDALKEAIDVAYAAGHRLYEFDEPTMSQISDTTKLELTLRNTITGRFNKELIWGLGDNYTATMEGIVNAPLTAYHQGKQIYWSKSMHNPTLDVAEQFYTNHGLPIENDKTWDYKNRYTVEEVPSGHEYYIEDKARTAKLNFYREPRYYAWVGFDCGKWYNLEAPDDRNALVVHNKSGEISGRVLDNYSITGFFTKKLVSYKLIMTQATHTGMQTSYAFPIIRLADLYLLYAEALNECKAAPDEEVYEYIQKVRDKAGLDKETGSLLATWQKYSNEGDKPTTKEGMREIIHRERLIELAFEGQRFFDLRRWRKSLEYCNKPIRGWNVTEKTEVGYYQVKYIYFRKFTPKDYFWPIKMDDIYVNRKLKQSPSWQ